MKKVLLVCTGNTCRSVMAHALFEILADKHGVEVEVKSAGTAAMPGDPPAEQAAEVIREYGGNISQHRSRRFRPELADEADLILAMTESHKQQILAQVPEAVDKVFLLKEYAYPDEVTEKLDVSDPFGLPVEVYRQTATEMERAILKALNRLTKGEEQMEIAIGSDHGAYRLKELLKKHLEANGYKVKDFGTYSEESCDYPDIGRDLAQKVANGEYSKGILLCGTGIGMSMAANKVKGVRAALCHDVYSAKMTRAHNDSNILCMGARVIGIGLATEIVEAWLNTEFEGGRHQQRIDKLEEGL